MSLMRSVLMTLFRFATFLLTFFLLGPIYYSTLYAINDVALAQGHAGLTTFVSWIYWMFYYGFATLLLVIGPLAAVIYEFLWARRRYYATEEVYG